MSGESTPSVTTGLKGERDPWRIREWMALPEVCLIYACDSSEIDQRGPVWLRDGSMHKACTPHWEGVVGVLGRQVEESMWADRDDAMVVEHV